MAFIRRVRTASGATAVQIAAYRAGRQEIVKHVGSAHTDVELGVLMERARELLGDPAQGVLDLGIEPTPRVLPLAQAPGGQGVLPAMPSLPAGRPVAARGSGGRVLATGSRLLYDALLGVVTALGFTAATDEVFCDLVIARIVEPTSLLDTGRVLTDLGRRPASYPTMNRTLRKAAKGDYRNRVAAACFAHASNVGDLTLCLYDVTTLYFEAEHEDDLRKVGYSKERRVDPQVVVRGRPHVSRGPQFLARSAASSVEGPNHTVRHQRGTPVDLCTLAGSGPLAIAGVHLQSGTRGHGTLQLVMHVDTCDGRSGGNRSAGRIVDSRIDRVRDSIRSACSWSTMYTNSSLLHSLSLE